MPSSENEIATHDKSNRIPMKKNYIAPSLVAVELSACATLLAGSNNGIKINDQTHDESYDQWSKQKTPSFWSNDDDD